MSQTDLFLIGDLPGFTPQIARLVSMMNYARSVTLQAVAGLGVEELDYLHDPQSNSIGTLLSHIAAAEVGYQAATFSEARPVVEREQPMRAPTGVCQGRRPTQRCTGPLIANVERAKQDSRGITG